MRVLLLDIEGTTTSISFVYDVLFPYARRELPAFVSRHWGDAAVREAARLMGAETADDAVRRALELMDGDVKDTGLKALQGLVWEDGYRGGELRGHVYEDVKQALVRAKARGVRVAIYSSGSVAAQKLLFGASVDGDLLPFIERHFDTTTGPKKESGSYGRIAAELGVAVGEVTFLTDNPDEADAARNAGMRVFVAVRPGNPALPQAVGAEWVTVRSLLEVPELADGEAG
ncbi:MAG TPA: acireductone synthase [Myxococcota bacterium]|nr:acireductone synthase [Myxococcota bacterium]